MIRFPILIEEGPQNYSASVRDLPGCVATGKTLEEVKIAMRQAILLHLQGMVEDGEPLPHGTRFTDILVIAWPPKDLTHE